MSTSQSVPISTHEHDGYLVVLKTPQGVVQSSNPHYRGLYRTRPFYVGEYEKGIDDPYFSGKYTNEQGLIPDLSLAKEVLMQFEAVENREAFEIIYVRTRKDSVSHTMTPPGISFLGFDIACYAPFWSIVVDLPTDQRLEGVTKRLNQYGLFNSFTDANDYLKEYQSFHSEQLDLVLMIWEVYLVE